MLFLQRAEKNGVINFIRKLFLQSRESIKDNLGERCVVIAER